MKQFSLASSPYDAYDELRRHSPIAWSEHDHAFLVTRHDDVLALSRQSCMSSAIPLRSFGGWSAETAETLVSVMRRQLDLMDGPRHATLRRILAAAFTGPRLARLQSFAEQWIERRMEELPPTFDIMTEIAGPLPAAVVLELFGLPTELREAFHRDVSIFAAGVGNPIDAVESISSALVNLRRLLAEVAQHPRLDDSGLLAIVRAAAPAPDVDDLVANAILIVAAGHQTSTNLIGNGAALLLRHPTERSLLTEQNASWSVGLEEILRFESPVQMVRRIATTNLKFRGVSIRQGDEVVFLLGSANRDPRAFVEPARFSVRRAPNRHVAFGAGPHTCLGAGLARLLARTALTALFAAPVRALDDEDEWLPSRAYRGLSRLRVSWR